MRDGTALLTTVALAALVALAAAAPAGATQPTEPSMTVELAADGDATVTVVSTFDLDSDDEQAAFDELRNNETARSAYTARFTDRWQAVANNTANETGREMTATNGSLSLSRSGSTGVATFSIEWLGLAAVERGTVTLSEPFASGFTTDRQFAVVLPEGYRLTSASPEPASSSDGRLVYDADTSLDGFSVVAESETPTAGGSGPGVGAVGALVAFIVAGLFAARRE